MADDGALTLQPGFSEELRGAATSWGYGSAEELLRHAFAEMKLSRDPPMAPAALKAFIQEGLDDIEAGRIVDFDLDGIVERGRKRLAALNR